MQCRRAHSPLCLNSGVSDPGEMDLDHAAQATQSLYLPELPFHVCFGPMPCGSLSVLDLPLKDLDATSPSIKHFADLVMDIPAASVDVDALKAISRDHAWDDLHHFMKPKVRPTCGTTVDQQYRSIRSASTN